MFTGKAGIATITLELKTSNGDKIIMPDTHEEVVPAEESLAVTNPAVVGISCGETIKTGEFASIKVGVFLSVTCETAEDDINQAWEFISDWASNKLQETSDAVKKEYGVD